MECTRCAGMKVPDIITEGGTRLTALRCIQCGDIIDRVIAWNRQRRRRPSQRRRPRTPVYGSEPGNYGPRWISAEGE
jgi:hypothetical protein